MKEFILMFKNTFNFSGKSSRREYWVAMLFNCIVSALLFVLVLPLVFDVDLMITAYISLTTLYEVLLFVPMLSLTVRRLRDAGKSPWWIFISLTFIGSIILLVWLAMPSEFRVKAWYAGYKDNPDEIKMQDDEKQTEYQTAKEVSTDGSTTQKDSVEKIIEELNEMKKNNSISQQEYDDLMSKLTKK